MAYSSDDHPLAIDLFRPDTKDVLPVVVLIHGGGWVAGHRDNMSILAEVLVYSGLAAASVEYRFAPKFPFPAAVKDVHAAVSFIKEEGRNHHLDPERIGAWGISAGGHLATCLAVSSSVHAAVNFCGLVDMVNYPENHPAISQDFLHAFLDPYDEDRNRAASPLYQVSPKTSPMMIVHGERDTVVPFAQSLALVSKLEEAGVEHRFIPLKYEDHSFSFEVWPEVEGASVRFLKEKLGL